MIHVSLSQIRNSAHTKEEVKMITPHPRANILTALAEGKRVRVKHVENPTWSSFNETWAQTLLSDRADYEFEVIEPLLEGWVIVPKELKIGFTTKMEALEMLGNNSRKDRVIFVREVEGS